jgi:hypothetical protein
MISEIITTLECHNSSGMYLNLKADFNDGVRATSISIIYRGKKNKKNQLSKEFLKVLVGGDVATVLRVAGAEGVVEVGNESTIIKFDGWKRKAAAFWADGRLIPVFDTCQIQCRLRWFFRFECSAVHLVETEGLSLQFKSIWDKTMGPDFPIHHLFNNHIDKPLLLTLIALRNDCLGPYIFYRYNFER